MTDIEGAPVTFHRLWSSDRERLQRHLLRLGPDDRQLRFGRASSDAESAEFGARIDWARSFLVGCSVDGVLRGVGELRTISRGWAAAAEAAISVERPFQGRGLGSALFDRLVTLAANRGIRRLYVLCATHNQKVQRIVRRHSAALTVYPHEVEGQIELPWPSHATVAREWLDSWLTNLQAALAPRPARG